MSEKLPHWNMSVIYPSVESDEYQNDMKACYALLDKTDEMMKSGERLKSVISSLNDALEILSNVAPYAHALLSTDTSNALYTAAVNKIDDLYVRYDATNKAFIRYAHEHKDEYKENEEYSLLFSEIESLVSHQMSPELEALASEFLSVSSSAWDRLQASVTSSIEKGGNTLIELRGMATDHDRAKRKDAFEREIAVLKEHETALCAALNGVKGTVLLLEKRRGWADPIDRSAFSSRISKKALDALIGALEKSLPLFRKYFAIKAKLMNLDKLSWFDIVAPVGESGKKYSFSDAKEIIISSYFKFSPEMGDFVKNAFENNWIDAEPRRGKVGGAYDTSFKKARVSRVLCNFDGSYDSVTTVAHELGHAYHDYVVKDIPSLLSDYPMTLAETASIFGETVVFTQMFSHLSREEKLPVIEQFVQSAAQVCVDILSRFYFERSMFAERRKGEVTAEKMCSLMLDAQKATYGDALDVYHPYMWAVKSHYYGEEFSYYNYPYAFGQLFALGLFKRSEGKSDFASEYKNLLSKTGMMSANDVARLAGIDIEDEGFWLESIETISSYIDALESYL